MEGKLCLQDSLYLSYVKEMEGPFEEENKCSKIQVEEFGREGKVWLIQGIYLTWGLEQGEFRILQMTKEASILTRILINRVIRFGGCCIAGFLQQGQQQGQSFSDLPYVGLDFWLHVVPATRFMQDSFLPQHPCSPSPTFSVSFWPCFHGNTVQNVL